MNQGDGPPDDLPPLRQHDEESEDSALTDKLRTAAERFGERADPAVKNAKAAVENGLEKLDPTLKQIGEKADAVIDKLDPALDQAKAEAQRAFDRLSKSAEPLTKQAKAGIGRFAAKLSAWASDAEEKSTEDEQE